MDGELVYFEIPTEDVERAQAFYGDLFDWRFEQGNFPGYFMIPNATPLGALSGEEQATGPRVFFGVRDIEAGVARVRELGGQAGDPQEIPSGHFARCQDDQGTPFTLWQSMEE